MNKLVVNTANDELFIVLQKDNAVFFKSCASKMHHNETMFSIIDEILKENELEIRDIDEFGVVVGPGSFTGIRVGIATIKAFRDSLNVTAKGINNLDYLFALAKKVDSSIETVAINGSRDSYFVGKFIHNRLYKYERNLTQSELICVAENKKIGMFKEDEVESLIVKQDAKTLLECLNNSSDLDLIPVYYQLSQAENEKIKRAQVEIFTANIDDLESISSLEKENISFNTMSENQIKTVLTDNNYIVLKAGVEGEIVGFVILQKSDELNIDSIVVNKSYRNFGVATKLIEMSYEIAKQNKINLSLEVSYNNITAYLLYKKLGFAERRIRKRYYQDGSDAIEMIKRV